MSGVPLQQTIFEDGPRSTFVPPEAPVQEVKGQVIIGNTPVVVQQGVDFSGLGAAVQSGYEAYKTARAEMQQRRAARTADDLAALEELSRRPIEFTDNQWENPNLVDARQIEFEAEYRKRLGNLGITPEQIDPFTNGTMAAKDVNDDVGIQEALIKYRGMYNDYTGKLRTTKSELEAGLYNGTMENLKMSIDKGFVTKENAGVGDILSDFDSKITQALKATGLADSAENYKLITDNNPNLGGLDPVKRRRIEGIREVYQQAVDARNASIRPAIERQLDALDVSLADEMTHIRPEYEYTMADYTKHVDDVKKKYDARVAELKGVYDHVPGFDSEMINQRNIKRLADNPNIPFSGAVLGIQKLDSKVSSLVEKLSTLDKENPRNADAVMQITKQLDELKSTRTALMDSVLAIPPGLLNPQNQKVHELIKGSKDQLLSEKASENANAILAGRSEQVAHMYESVNSHFDSVMSMLADLTTASKGTVTKKDFVGALKNANVRDDMIQAIADAWDINLDDDAFTVLVDETRIDKARSNVIQQFFRNEGLPLDVDGSFVDKNQLTASIQRKLFERKAVETGDMGFAATAHESSAKSKKSSDAQAKVRNLALGIPMSSDEVVKATKNAADTVGSMSNYPGYTGAALFKTYTREGAQYLASTFGTDAGRRKLISTLLDPAKRQHYDMRDIRVFSRQLMEDANQSWGADTESKRDTMRFGFFLSFLSNKLPTETNAKSSLDYRINPESIDAEFKTFSQQWDKTFDLVESLAKGRGDSVVSVHRAVMGITSGSDMTPWRQSLPIGESVALKAEKQWAQQWGLDTFFSSSQMPTIAGQATDLVMPFVIAAASAPPGSTPDDIIKSANSVAQMFGNVRPKTVTTSDGVKHIIPSRDVKYATEVPPSIAPTPDDNIDPSMVSPTDALEHTYSSIVYGGTNAKEGAYPASRKKVSPELKYSRDDMYQIVAGFSNGKVTADYIRAHDPLTSGLIDALCDWADDPKTKKSELMNDPRIQRFVSFNGTASKDSEQYKEREMFIWRHTGMQGRGSNDGKLTGLAMAEIGLNMYSGASPDLSPADRSRLDVWRRVGDYTGVYEADIDPDTVTNRTQSLPANGLAIPQPALGQRVMLSHPLLKTYGIDSSAVGAYGRSVYGPRVNKDIAEFQGGDFIRNRVGRKVKTTRSHDWGIGSTIVEKAAGIVEDRLIHVDPNNEGIYYIPNDTLGIRKSQVFRVVPSYKRNRFDIIDSTPITGGEYPAYIFSK